MFSKKEQWIIFGTVNGLVLTGILLFPLYLKFMELLPVTKCAAILVFNTYCPACGGTRALSALLHFDIIGSFIYNPIVPVFAIIFVWYEIFMIKHLIKGQPRDTFCKAWLAFGFLGFWFTYTLVRCGLLWFGIDLLGDIL